MNTCAVCGHAVLTHYDGTCLYVFTTVLGRDLGCTCPDTSRRGRPMVMSPSAAYLAGLPPGSLAWSADMRWLKVPGGWVPDISDPPASFLAVFGPILPRVKLPQLIHRAQEAA